jgi:hypothetical protein
LPATYRVLLHGDPNSYEALTGLNWNRALRIADVIRRLGGEASVHRETEIRFDESQDGSEASIETSSAT